MSEPNSKPFEISKQVVFEEYRRVKANKGAAGVDDESIAAFEVDLKGNLYKLWNRMSSGSYLPPPVKMVEIPKPGGKGSGFWGTHGIGQADPGVVDIALHGDDDQPAPLLPSTAATVRPAQRCLHVTVGCPSVRLRGFLWVWQCHLHPLCMYALALTSASASRSFRLWRLTEGMRVGRRWATPAGSPSCSALPSGRGRSGSWPMNCRSAGRRCHSI